MEMKRIEVPFGETTLTLETGKLAKQSNGAVTVIAGGTVVLVTACMAKKIREDIDFFPLMVEYQEKTYSAGKIPGGFFKREGKPTQKEVLTSRLIDRPIRPLFPIGFLNDVQVVATVLSSDSENDPDIMAIIGASAALTISDIPFDGPIGAVRIGMVEGKFIVNPTYAQRDLSTLDLTVVGTRDKIIMIEGEGQEIPEAKVIEALEFAQKQLPAQIDAQEKFRKTAGLEKAVVNLMEAPEELKDKVAELAGARLSKVYQIAMKQDREDALSTLKQEILSDLSVFAHYKVGNRDVVAGDILRIFEEIEYEIVRESIFKAGKRADGRGLKDVRALSSEINILPRTHGSSLFTRGQTQSLAVITLGTKRDEQLIEGLEETTYENFMLHYNFPSFSVGEVKPMRGPGRREIGHGALAAKALRYVLPPKDKFPYTIRIVSEILESNGSSSMASVCSGCLGLMDAGVPITEMVAGISVGIVTEGKDYRLLTDIMGLEDHFGDMDYKIAGTKNGVTAIQLDLKIAGLSVDILAKGMAQATEARKTILDTMQKTISKPKDDISQYAPRILTTYVPVEKIGEVIGPGGKMIKKIIEETGVESIDIEDDGKVLIASLNRESAMKALAFVNGMTEMPQVGKTYDVRVEKIMNFGAFVEYLPGRQGLIHVSELSNTFVKDVASVVKVGDHFKAKIIEIDELRRVNLSKKQVEQEAASQSPSS